MRPCRIGDPTLSDRAKGGGGRGRWGGWDEKKRFGARVFGTAKNFPFGGKWPPIMTTASASTRVPVATMPPGCRHLPRSAPRQEPDGGGCRKIRPLQNVPYGRQNDFVAPKGVLVSDKMVLLGRIFILWPDIFIPRGADLKSGPPDGAAAAQNEIAGLHFHFVARTGRFVGRCFPARGRRMWAVSH